MNKRVILVIKIVVMALVVAGVAWALRDAWSGVAAKKINVQWRWGVVAVLGFCASMLTGGTVWRFLAWKMGDRSSTVPLLGAYTFSQMGKYIPGKVALLLMRMERSKRFGMTTRVCTLSTLLENALYLVSGGLVGMTTVVRVLEELRARGMITAAQQRWQWPVMAAAMIGLGAACHPAVFYRVVNGVLRKMTAAGRGGTGGDEVPASERLGMGTLAIAVVGFLPCWFFGGVALWGATMCVERGAGLDWQNCWWFAGAYALSVTLGMVSLLPGGLGIRETVLGVAVTLQLSPVLGHDHAVLVGAMAAGLQRLFQVVAEITLGIMGGMVTGVSGKHGNGGGAVVADGVALPEAPTAE